MKKVLVSSALSALLVLPASAIEIYNDDDKKVELYGSIRGFVGYSESIEGTDRAKSLFGIQSNSQFGVRTQMGKFKANVEIGAREPGITADTTAAPYRQYWGSYDTGYGVVLFGKTNTSTIDNGFSSNWLNIDTGMIGFGGLTTGHRRIQLQYNVAGFSIGVLEDAAGGGWNGYPISSNQDTPRIAASYTINNNKGQPFFKIAGSYKYYVNLTDNTNTTTPSTNAYHIWLGLRPTFGNSFLSLVAQYGKNGYLYGEQAAGAYSKGQYTLITSGINEIGLGAEIVGGKIEFGTKLSQDVSLILGAGYQATSGGSKQIGNNNGPIHGYAVFLQLPYKANANVEIAPQVAFYNTEGKTTSTLIDGSNKRSSVIAGARVKWDF